MLHGLMLAAVLAFPAQADGKLHRYEFRARHMGVAWKIALYAPDEAVANTAAKAAFSRIGELNRIFSDYEPDSELMRLCRTSRPGKPVKVSRELFEVLSHSQSVSKESGGAFDVTVGHVTRLWRNARRRKRFPKPEEIQAAMKKTGYRFVKLDPKRHTVELLKPGMRLDLGGIAKGYAGDAALAVLKKRGIARAMIDGSGDIVVGDSPPGKMGWEIAVESLQGGRRKAEGGKRKAEGGKRKAEGGKRKAKALSTTHHSEAVNESSPGGTASGSLGRKPQGSGPPCSRQPRRGGIGSARRCRPSGADANGTDRPLGLTPQATRCRPSGTECLQFGVVQNLHKLSPLTTHHSPANFQRSTRNRERPARILTLKNCAVATSGDAYQFIEFNGKRYSHIVDPKTGLGLTRRSSVTVVAPTGWQADAYASAVSVLGPERGIKLIAAKRGVEASVTVLRDGKPVTVRTRGFLPTPPDRGK